MRYPTLKPDIEIIPQAAPGRRDRFLAREPESGDVFELSDRDLFICRQLNGETSPREVRQKFHARFGSDLGSRALAALVRQLGESGLLAFSSARDVEPSPWDAMKRLPLPTHGLIVGLAHACGWCFGWIGQTVFGLLLATAVGVVATHWGSVTHALRNVVDLITDVGTHSGPPSETLLRLALILAIIPLLREVAKAVAARHFTGRVPEIRYRWALRLVPRIGADIGILFGLDSKRRQLQVVCAGLQCELLLFSIGTLGCEFHAAQSVEYSFLFSLALASAISAILNAIPLGSNDGSIAFATWREIPDFRRRAIRAARSMLLFQPAPEPLAPELRRQFIAYGLAADIYNVALNGLVLFLAGYLLINWQEGLGATVFLVIVALRFESDIRRFFMSLWPLTKRKLRNWAITLGVILVLVIVGLLPYPYDINTEFRVQPGDEREIRSPLVSQISAILVDEGAMVTGGQQVVLLDRVTLERRLASTRSMLNMGRSRLTLIESGPRPEEIAVAEQDVKLKATHLHHTQRQFERAQKLSAEGHISEQEFDNTTRQMAVDAEELELSRRRLDLVKAGVPSEEIDARREEVNRLEMEMAYIEEDLARTVIRTPISGCVTTLFLARKIGQRVNIGDVLAIVEQNADVLVRAAVPEQHAGAVRVGSHIKLRPWAYSDLVFTGEVSSIAGTVVDRNQDVLHQALTEQELGTVRSLNAPSDKVLPVLARISNPDGLLVSEMTGFAKIEGGTRTLGGALLAPVIRFVRVRIWSWIP